jgi:hypothetical protein
MLVTALNPDHWLRQGRQGREEGPQGAHDAARSGSALGFLSAEEFDAAVVPEDMTHP